jgi:hypothetical protein
VVAAEITTLPIVIGFLSGLAVFGAYLPWMIHDSRRPMRLPDRAPAIAREPTRFTRRTHPPVQRAMSPLPKIPAWRVAITITSFVVLSTWSMRAARSRRSARR